MIGAESPGTIGKRGMIVNHTTARDHA
jgi:hypothetical protein